MSYCVNCGVELEQSEKRCPLCNVEVINPEAPYDPSLPRPYSPHIVRVQARLERRYLAWIITILVLLAGIVCVVADLVYVGGMTWSVYVVAGLMMAWVLVLLPLMTGIHPVLAVLLDVCALLAFLYVINMADTSSDWYLTLAMPQVLLYGALALLDVLLWRGRLLKGWQRYGVIVMSIGVALMGLEVLLDLFNDMRVELDWSWFVIIPAFAVGIILFLLERKREVKEEILKRLRV